MTSEARAVRDALADRISKLGTFITVKRSIVEQIEPADQLPAATVFIIRESAASFGDANAGEPHYANTVTLGITVTISEGEQMDLEPTLDIYADQVITVLLQDPEFLSGIESVESWEQTQSFPSQGETYYAEGRIQASIVCHPKYWEPIVLDDYRKTVLVTRQLGSDPQAPALETVIDLATD